MESNLDLPMENPLFSHEPIKLPDKSKLNKEDAAVVSDFLKNNKYYSFIYNQSGG
jgi:hypothetical protein